MVKPRAERGAIRRFLSSMVISFQADRPATHQSSARWSCCQLDAAVIAIHQRIGIAERSLSSRQKETRHAAGSVLTREILSAR
ncbi:hypothetical protein KAM426_20450 [Aquipseudomonas alcaligenes]|nr:hypothetical protein KAM426_20450 [Pseudomonas alcaligenes]